MDSGGFRPTSFRIRRRLPPRARLPSPTASWYLIPGGNSNSLPADRHHGAGLTLAPPLPREADLFPLSGYPAILASLNPVGLTADTAHGPVRRRPSTRSADSAGRADLLHHRPFPPEDGIKLWWTVTRSRFDKPGAAGPLRSAPRTPSTALHPGSSAWPPSANCITAARYLGHHRLHPPPTAPHIAPHAVPPWRCAIWLSPGDRPELRQGNSWLRVCMG